MRALPPSPFTKNQYNIRFLSVTPIFTTSACKLSGRLATVYFMTSSKNTNAPRREDEPASHQHEHHNIDADLDHDWSAFMSEYADDLNDVLRSRIAKSFEKHVQKELKEQEKRETAVRSAYEHTNNAPKNNFSLKNLSSQKSYIIPQRMQDSHIQFVTPHGPRDNIRSSWLDLDNTMEDYGEDFVPPNPHFDNVSLITVLLWLMFVAGIVGVILCAFLPLLASIIGIASGLLILLGGAGLLMRRKKHDLYHEDYTDYGDGARV